MEQQNQKRENSGYLFKNKDKRTDKQPDYRGKMNIGGKDWLVSGWTRNKDGEEMISIAVTDPASLPVREAPAASATPRQSGPAGGASPASGPFARPAPAVAPAKAFQPAAGKAATGGAYEDFEDLDSLFKDI